MGIHGDPDSAARLTNFMKKGKASLLLTRPAWMHIAHLNPDETVNEKFI